jgi:ribosomal protein L21E
MAVEEIVSRRTASAKTFDLGGGRRRVVIGKCFHHRVKGEWVDTVCDWHESTRELLSGQYPYVVKVNKGTNAVTILREGETVPVTLAPMNHNKKAEPTYEGNTVTVAGLWTGVDLRVVLGPEQPVIQFVKTSETFVNPALSLTGLAVTAPMLVAGYTAPNGKRVAVSATLQYGSVVYDLTNVPLNTAVS